MIKIYNGKIEAIQAHVLKTYNSSKTIIINSSDEFAIPFLLIRKAIPLLKALLGAKTVNAVLKDYDLLITTLFKDDSFSFFNREKFNLITASLSSNITHSRVAKDTLIRQSSEILHQLLRKNELKIIIPDITQMDTGSIDVLRYLYHVSSRTAPDIVIGYDSDWGPTTFEKEIGVSWYKSVDSVIILQAFVHSLKDKAAAIETITGDPNLPLQSKKATPLKLDVEDEGLEWLVFQKTKSFPKPITAEEAFQIFNAIEKCFRLFDFTNTLFLGLKALGFLLPYISDSQKGKLYHMIGLSAHNRHFFSQNNQVLATFLLDVFKKALAFEKDSARKTAILYRLIVTTSRRMNDIPLASEYLEQAYLEIKTGSFKGYDKPVLTAWINNIDSFILMKRKKMEAAINRQAKGYYLLECLQSISIREVKIEIEYTKAVLAENLATLNSFAENFDAMGFWYSKEVSFSKKWPSLNATAFAELQSFHFQNLQLKQALKKTEKGLLKSKESFNYILEYFFTLSAGDINFRIGNTEKAILYFKRAITMQSEIDFSYISMYELQILIIKSHIQLSAYNTALAQLTNIDTDSLDSIENHIEVKSLIAYCYAKNKKTVLAIKHMNRGIDLAIQSAEARLLFKVSLRGGMIAKALFKNETQGFYKKALELCDVTIDGNSFKPSSEDKVRLYIGLYEAEKQNTSWLFMAIDDLVLALKKNADIWQELKPIINLILKLPKEIQIQCFTSKQDILQKITKAAAQRKDCKKELLAQ